VKKETPKPREEAFVYMFYGRAGHLDEFYNTSPSNSCNLILIIIVTLSLNQVWNKFNLILSKFKFRSEFHFHLNMFDLWSKCPKQNLFQIFKSTLMKIFIIF
jgi:hypothetical protein